MVTEIRVPTDPDWPARVRARAHHNMSHYEGCTQSMVAAFMDELGMADPLVFRAAGGMHGGMVSSLTCGIVSAGMMVLGLLVGREKLEAFAAEHLHCPFRMRVHPSLFTMMLTQMARSKKALCASTNAP